MSSDLRRAIEELDVMAIYRAFPPGGDDWLKRCLDHIAQTAILRAQDREAGAVAWIEHHKGGDNLVWERSNLPCDPLYAQPAAQDADAALERAAQLCDALEKRCNDACAKLEGDAYWRADGGSDGATELATAIRAMKSAAEPADGRK